VGYGFAFGELKVVLEPIDGYELGKLKGVGARPTENSIMLHGLLRYGEYLMVLLCLT
jgi:hypothetical protein